MRRAGPRRSDSRTRLLLCGSALSFMGKLLSGNAPLRGRASLDLTVQTLDYRLAAQFWGFQDPRLAFLVHAIVGGTPAYRTEMIRFDAPRRPSRLRRLGRPGHPFAGQPDVPRGALPAGRGARPAGHGALPFRARGHRRRQYRPRRHRGHVGRKTNELSHPLTVLEDAGLILRENDAFRANRTDFRINEPLLAFYHAIMRPFWPQLMRGRAPDRSGSAASSGSPAASWARTSSVSAGSGRSTSPVTGSATGPPRSRRAPSTTRRTRPVHQIDVAVLGHADGGRPPLLAIGEAKWNEQMGMGHIERLAPNPRPAGAKPEIRHVQDPSRLLLRCWLQRRPEARPARRRRSHQP